MDVIIVGSGVGGLTLALALQQAGIPCRVVEAAEALRPVGVGINILPHAARVLSELGLEAALSNVAIATREAIFFNRFGQLIYREPLGRHAGYEFPQFSIHRGDLQQVLLNAFLERVGPDRLHTAHRCAGFAQDEHEVIVFFHDAADKSTRTPQRGRLLVACDGLHSVVRKQLHPEEGEPRYSGVNMWRGTTRWRPILTGASMIRAGWLAGGKMVIYPIRDRVDGTDLQLVNWVAEIATPEYTQRDWNRPGQLADFLPAFADWHFDWLDVPALLRAADAILEFPMIDQDPVAWWSRGRVTLLGDAAHPMVPRGSNGAGQAILDARALTDCLVTGGNVVDALRAYEAMRLQATANVVLANRRNPPDAILREVFERTGDRPFARIEDVISEQEIRGLSDSYKRVAGYARPTP
ncbi:MAG: flavin-dependent oxidoreductase [Betaproteobacteria bacterium]|nr:flavin-dependent oxidoreductase [Betaproteobacteria bacterium]